MQKAKLDNEQNEKTEQYISSLNSQISQLETQIELLQGKVEEMNIKNNITKQNQEQYEDTIAKYEDIINEERNKNQNANAIIDSLRKEILCLKEENDNFAEALAVKEKRKQFDPLCASNCNMSSDEDNEYLKKFIGDLHDQIDDLNNELQNVKSENLKLLTERNNVLSSSSMSNR